MSSTCAYNMVNFGPLTAAICLRVWDTPANFNGFCVLAALLHGTLVVGVCQAAAFVTEGATYIRQGGHHVHILVLWLMCFCNQWLLQKAEHCFLTDSIAWLLLHLTFDTDGVGDTVVENSSIFFLIRMH